MKNSMFNKITGVIILMICLGSSVFAQTRDDIFKKETPLTWLGIDFTQAKFFGDAGTVSTSGMINFYSRINFLIMSEPDKYNLPKTFDKVSVIPNLEMVEKMNREIDESKILSYNLAEFSRLDADKIQNIVNNYNTGDVKGLAVIFIMEGMSKTMEKASMWVAFFDAPTKKVLHTSRHVGNAGGFGFRNYWAAAINDVLKDIRSKEYKNWKKTSGQGK